MTQERLDRFVLRFVNGSMLPVFTVSVMTGTLVLVAILPWAFQSIDRGASPWLVGISLFVPPGMVGVLTLMLIVRQYNTALRRSKHLRYPAVAGIARNEDDTYGRIP